MSSTFYFDFLGSVWDFLPEADRERMGEMWQGFEQVFATVYQKFWEGGLNTSVRDLVPFTTERWLPYTFDDSNFVSQPATFTSSQDLSQGANLFTRYLLRFRIDGGTIFEVDCRGANPLRTLMPEVVAKINSRAGFRFARSVFDGTILQLLSTTSGVGSSIEFLPTSDPALNACEFILGVLASDLPRQVPEYPYIYKLPYTRISSIPELRDAIRDETVAVRLLETTDYQITKQALVSFRAAPQVQLWAKRTLVDEENPWNNFGFMMDIYQPNSARYVNVIQGLWFAFWTGSKPINVQRSLYLLFGLPTARDAGTVVTVTATDMTIITTAGQVQVYPVPTGLLARVAAGDVVERFQPLVTGIEVFDKENRPGFVASEIGRSGIQRFLTEKASRGPGADTDETRALRTLEEYTFLPQISVDAFVTPDINLDNVRTFLDAVKPLNKTYFFQVIVGNFRDAVPFGERLAYNNSFDVTPTIGSNITSDQLSETLDSYETVDNPGLNLDLNGVLFGEKVSIEVRQNGTLVDSFDA
jgi:hypothetical protein